jgi:hypothetical protein
MNDQIYERLRAIDPEQPADEQGRDDAWIGGLAARAMAADAPPPPRRRLAAPLAVAAAVTLIVGGVVTATVMTGGDNAARDTPAAAAKPALKLTAPAPNTASMCIQFTPEILAGMPVAFSGTVASVGADTVTLDVDHWYRGGDQAQVEIGRLDDTAIALVGIPEFKPGDRYLVTATDGVVSACGYTAPWSSDLAETFAAAFE